MKYQPALDGLRALCIAVVFLYHCRIGVFPSGFIGVDVFFVLSGYLITHLVCLDVERHGRLRLGTFLERRARRLLPALWFSLLLAWAVWEAAGAQVPFRTAFLPVFFYYGNWVAAYHGFGRLDPLGPTWSLAIEVQFYLVWPFVVWLLWARPPLRRLAPLVTAGLVVGFALGRLWLFPEGTPLGAYPSTLTRVDVLLVGGLLAMLERQLPAWAAGARHGAVGLLAGAALAALTTIACWRVGHTVFHRGVFTLVALLSAAIIAHVGAAPEGLLARVLAWSPLVALGKRSYGVYLFHYLVIQVTEVYRHSHLLTEAQLMTLRLLLTLAVTWLSFEVIEEPVRRFRAGASGPAAPAKNAGSS